LLNWCDRNDVDYIVGIARNPRLEALVEPLWDIVKQRHAQRKAHGETGSTKAFWRYRYQAKSWRYARDVIAKAELTDKGTNRRYGESNQRPAVGPLCQTNVLQALVEQSVAFDVIDAGLRSIREPAKLLLKTLYEPECS